MKVATQWKHVPNVLQKVPLFNYSLRRWHIASALLFITQGACILLFSASHTVPLNAMFVTKDVFQSQLTHHTVMALGLHQLCTLNISELIAVYFLLAACMHIAVVTVFRKRYEAMLKAGYNTFRWLEYAWSAGIVFVLVAMLAGIYDAAFLAMVLVCGVMCGIVGLLIECRVSPAAISAIYQRLLVVLAALGMLLPIVIVCAYVLGSRVFGDGVASGYMAYVVPTLVLLLCAFCWNVYKTRSRSGSWADYAYAERMYMMLSFIIRTALAWEIFAAILRP